MNGPNQPLVCTDNVNVVSENKYGTLQKCRATSLVTSMEVCLEVNAEKSK